jgi:hypothetical protein
MSDLTLRAYLRSDLSFEQKMDLGRGLWDVLIPYLRNSESPSSIEWRSGLGVDVQDLMLPPE